jgi:hypothetical protein
LAAVGEPWAEAFTAEGAEIAEEGKGGLCVPCDLSGEKGRSLEVPPRAELRRMGEPDQETSILVGTYRVL